MGGAEHCGNMSPTAEFNFWFDPEAAKIVFEAGFKEIVMIGLDVTRKAFMTPAMRELLYQDVYKRQCICSAHLQKSLP